MILGLHPGTDPRRVQDLLRRIESQGIRTTHALESAHPVVAAVDPVPASLRDELVQRAEVRTVDDPAGSWRRVARAFREEPTVVSVGGVPVGGSHVAVVAGPCSVEGRDAMLEAARHVAACGAHILRGGAFKPRTSPYAFQGLGADGLRLLKEAGDAVGLPVLSEIMDASQSQAFVDRGVDCLQVGARNMQNFTLLKAIARLGIPVVLKRGLSATLAEWLQSAEYLAAHGCDEVILCERGIRTFETATRNTLDLTVLPLLAAWTHLPVIVDPSHAAGVPACIPPLARAAVAVGAHGVAVEMHPRPSSARSDGAQALLPGELATVVADARIQAALAGHQFGESGGDSSTTPRPSAIRFA